MATTADRHVHQYAARLTWEGNLGEGTSTYTGYSRRYRVAMAGKPELVGTADPAFRGEADKHNPEDLFVTAISACHMLSYLALCARAGIRVMAYEDDASGVMREDGRGGGTFEEVVLRPQVTIAQAQREAEAMALHEKAHEQCYIASSCRVPIRHEPTVRILDPAS